MSRLLQAAGAELINARWSVLDPGTHITPHCGVTNSKLRVHIGVQVAAGGRGLRVGNEWRVWSEGKVAAQSLPPNSQIETYIHSCTAASHRYALLYLSP